MTLVDWIIILVALLGLYIGWCAGLFKALTDSIVLIISSILSGILSKLIVSNAYSILPFFNFTGRVQGLKSINIIFYRIVVYAIILLLILALFDSLSKKIKLKEKLVDSMIEINFISRIFGVICFIPALIVFLYNALLVLHLPNLNFSSIHEANLSQTILTKTPVLASQNKDVYEACVYAVEQINSPDNTMESYKNVNDRIIGYLENSDLISSSNVSKLKADNKLLGKRKSSKYDVDDDNYDPDLEDDSDSSDDRNTDDGDNNNYEDNGDEDEDYDYYEDGGDEDGDYDYYEDGSDDIYIDEDEDFYYEDDSGVYIGDK